jgi:nitronate monooxygenase
MSLPKLFDGRLRLPVIAAPLFIVSQAELVIEECKAGVVGTMPSLNVRDGSKFEATLIRIGEALEAARAANPGKPIAPYGINLNVHRTNERLMHDLEICVRRKVPIIITSLGTNPQIVEAVHGYGGIVLHDIINMKHARKAIASGVDGIVAVCAGAGGHAGALSPFALVRELRAEFGGIIALSGAISDGAGILAAISLGADFAYMGTRFIATAEANAAPEYKQMLIAGTAEDVVYSSAFTGVLGNYLRPSIIRAGLDPENLPVRDSSIMDFGDSGSTAKAWKDIWSAGQGIGTIHDAPPTSVVVTRLAAEFDEAVKRVQALQAYAVAGR